MFNVNLDRYCKTDMRGVAEWMTGKYGLDIDFKCNFAEDRIDITINGIPYGPAIHHDMIQAFLNLVDHNVKCAIADSKGEKRPVD